MRLQKKRVQNTSSPPKRGATPAGRQRRRRYRLLNRGARWPLAVAALCLALGGACAGAPAASEEGAQSASTRSAAEVLYEALHESVEANSPGVDVSSQEQLLVVSHYESLTEARRRRLVARVVPVGRGVGVRVVAEYQRRIDDEEGAQRWEPEVREQHAEEAQRWELAVAREAERRFHRRR